MSIDVIIPSRERPSMAERTGLSAKETAEVEVSVGVDYNDPRLPDYEVMCHKNGFNLVVHQGEGSAPACTETVIKATHGNIISIAPDDTVFRTHGWDKKLEAILAKNDLLMVSPNNKRDRRKLEHPMCSRRWVEIVGHLFPDYGHFFADEWIEMVATKANLMYYAMDIVLEHMHPKYGKGIWDDVYLRKRMTAEVEKDRDLFVTSNDAVHTAAMKLVRSSQRAA